MLTMPATLIHYYFSAATLFRLPPFRHFEACRYAGELIID